MIMMQLLPQALKDRRVVSFPRARRRVGQACSHRLSQHLQSQRMRQQPSQRAMWSRPKKAKRKPTKVLSLKTTHGLRMQPKSCSLTTLFQQATNLKASRRIVLSLIAMRRHLTRTSCLLQTGSPKTTLRIFPTLQSQPRRTP